MQSGPCIPCWRHLKGQWTVWDPVLRDRNSLQCKVRNYVHSSLDNHFEIDDQVLHILPKQYLLFIIIIKGLPDLPDTNISG